MKSSSQSYLISKLPLQPIGFHMDIDIAQKLAKRGKLALEYQHLVCKEYTGVAFDGYYDDEDKALETGLPGYVSSHFHLQHVR